jgi:hypothetical protein
MNWAKKIPELKKVKNRVIIEDISLQTERVEHFTSGFLSFS